MTWIQERYYDLRTYLRNLFKSSTEEWLEAELMAVDEALGFTPNSTRFPGDRIAKIGNMNEANTRLFGMWEKVQNKVESLSQDNLSLRRALNELVSEFQEEGKKYAAENRALDEQIEQMKEREAELKAAWADDAKMYQEERDKLKRELKDEKKWSQDMAELAEQHGDKIGKLQAEIVNLKASKGAR